MKIFDISIPLSMDLPFYPGDPVFSIREHAQISNGDSVNVSEWKMGSHTGTHLDAPKHFYDDGLSVDQIPLSRFCGPARVLDLRGNDVITKENLKVFHIQPNENILLKTDNSTLLHEKNFSEHYVYLSGDGAEYLSQIGVNLVAIDYLSIEEFGGNHPFPAHRNLLGAEIIVLEGVDLSNICAGTYWLCAFPINIRDGNGSPVRAVLISE